MNIPAANWQCISYAMDLAGRQASRAQQNQDEMERRGAICFGNIAQRGHGKQRTLQLVKPWPFTPTNTQQTHGFSTSSRRLEHLQRKPDFTAACLVSRPWRGQVVTALGLLALPSLLPSPAQPSSPSAAPMAGASPAPPRSPSTPGRRGPGFRSETR